MKSHWGQISAHNFMGLCMCSPSCFELDIFLPVRFIQFLLLVYSYMMDINDQEYVFAL